MRPLRALLILCSLAPWVGLAADGGEEKHPPLVIEEKSINPKHPDRELVAVAKAAHKAHKRVLVEFGASWCVACELVKPVFWRAENRALFSGWELVQVDVDQLPDGPVLGIPFDTIPFFMKLDATGHVAGTLRGSDVLGGRPTDAQVDAAFARFLGT